MCSSSIACGDRAPPAVWPQPQPPSVARPLEEPVDSEPAEPAPAEPASRPSGAESEPDAEPVDAEPPGVR